MIFIIWTCWGWLFETIATSELEVNYLLCQDTIILDVMPIIANDGQPHVFWDMYGGPPKGIYF